MMEENRSRFVLLSGKGARPHQGAKAQLGITKKCEELKLI